MIFRRKKTWLVLALLLLAAGTVVVFWVPIGKQPPPQFITLAGGMKYQFVGATWGTNHRDPTDRRLVARLADSLPARISNFIYDKFGTRLQLQRPRQTAEPTLWVWLKPAGADWPIGPATAIKLAAAGAILADGNGTEAGQPCGLNLTFAGSSTMQAFKFTELPRRSEYLECHFYDSILSGHIIGGGFVSETNGTTPVELGRIRFANPAYGRYPKWQPETLPADKETDGLVVRVADCFIGFSKDEWKPTGVSLPPKPAGETSTFFELRFASKAGVKETWAVQSLELGDSTGNFLRTSPRVLSPLGFLWPGDPNHRYYVDGNLWPDEPASRLRLGLKRTSGIPAEDLITFSNLPAKSGTRHMAVTNIVQGIPIVVRNYQRDMVTRDGSGHVTGPCVVEIELPNPSSEVAVDLVDIRADSGEKMEIGWWRVQNNNYYSLDFQKVPAGTQTLNVTLAVQKPRTVEFFVKPYPLTEIRGESGGGGK